MNTQASSIDQEAHLQSTKAQALPILRMILTDKNANNPATQQLRVLFSNPYSFHQAKALIVDDPAMYELLQNKEHQKIVDHPSCQRLIAELEDAPIRSQHHSLPIKSDGSVNMYLVCNESTPAYDEYAANIDETPIQSDDNEVVETEAYSYQHNEDVARSVIRDFHKLPVLDEAHIQSDDTKPAKRGYISQLEVLTGKPAPNREKHQARTILQDFDLMEGYQTKKVDSPTEDKQLLGQRYNIEATGRQVDDISYACELTARINIGQINAIMDALPIREGTDTYALQQQIEALIKPHLKQPEPNLPSFFTMHQTLRHRRSWDIHPEGGMTVNFDEPLVLTDDPLLKINKAF